MNQKTTYEFTISRKLEEVPVPDLSELIWSRIEKELDNDPGDTPGGNNPSPPSPAGRIIIGGLGLVMIIAFLINYFNSKKENTITPAEYMRTQEPAIIQEPNSPVKENVTPFISPSQKAPGRSNEPTPVRDTVTNEPVIIDSPALSVDTASVYDIPKAAPAVNDSTGKKKPRGVQGISEGDYRIVPKKDSL